MREVVASSLHPLQIQFQEKGVRLVSDVQPRRSPRCTADEQQISWVITNLVTNALKYTPAGGTVTVRGQDDREGLRLEVQDTGVGIPKEYPRQDLRQVCADQADVRTPHRGVSGSAWRLPRRSWRCTAAASGWTVKSGKGSTFAFVLPVRAGTRSCCRAREVAHESLCPAGG